MDKKKPLLSVRPHFDPGIAATTVLPVAIIGVIVVTVLGGTFVFVLFSILGLMRFFNAGYLYGLLLVGSLVALPPLLYEMRKRAYQRTIFNFFEDYLDFQHFQLYLNRRQGRVRYRDIGSIDQRATPWQERKGLTTLYVHVPGMELSRTGFAGLAMPDLPQSQNYIGRIMDIVEKSYAATQTAPPAPPTPPVS